MKILIKEGIVKKMVNRVLGYDLSDRIRIITDWEETNDWIKMIFNQNYKGFNLFVDTYGPIYLFEIEGYNFILQYRDGRWFIIGGNGGTYNSRSEEYFLDKIGLGFMGVKVKQIMDEFIG